MKQVLSARWAQFNLYKNPLLQDLLSATSLSSFKAGLYIGATGLTRVALAKASLAPQAGPPEFKTTTATIVLLEKNLRSKMCR